MRELYFRVDTNDVVATGHIMRCLSIADAARNLGITPVFILADDTGKRRVEERGYRSIILDSKWDDLYSESDKLKEVIINNDIKVLVVDSYYASDEYFSKISEITNVIYIDDLGSFEYPVSGVVCYANYYDKFDYPKRFVDSKVNFYLGCDYVPLRKEFEKIEPKEIKENIESVLLLSGGGDQNHALKTFVQSLSTDFDFKIIAICGQYNTDYDELERTYSEDEHVKIYKSVDNMLELMQGADLAISAGGTTLYELSACGTPTITYSFTDNQLDNVYQFEKDRLMKYAGDMRNGSIIEALERYIYFYSSKEKREEASLGLKKLVDGLGAKRLVEKIVRDYKL